jgi:hypothetical protein
MRAMRRGIFAAACAAGLFVAAATRGDAPPTTTGAPALVEPPDAPRVISATRPTTAPATLPATAPATAPASQPGTAPTTGVAAATQPKPFPENYGLLLKRSPFARGAPQPQGPNPPGGPEANLGLRGVLLLDGQFTALVEDLGSKRAGRHKAGEAVGPGKIKSITIDAIEYENAGTTRQVTIGQNLLGLPLPPQPPPPPPPPPQQAQPGQPGGPPQPGQPGGPGGPPPGARVIRR